MIILGVDPGLGRIGYGAVSKVGSRLSEVEHGLIETPPIAKPDRLRLIHEELTEVLHRLRPDAVATERLLFATNKTTAIDVAGALGVIQLAIGQLGVPWCEYSPPEIKQAVVGHGTAEKKQVQFMVTKLLSLQQTPKPDDVADALAIAICHAMRANGLGAR